MIVSNAHNSRPVVMQSECNVRDCITAVQHIFEGFFIAKQGALRYKFATLNKLVPSEGIPPSMNCLL